MKLRPESRETGESGLPAFLALGGVALIVILAVTVAATSGPEDVHYTIVPPDNATANVTATPAASPTPTPHPYRVVSGANASSDAPEGGSSGENVGQVGDKSAKHIAYAFQPNVSGITDFVAYWTVPQRPYFNGIQNHTIFLWTGIQLGTSGLVQAVLEWDHDHTGRYWTLACWVVNKKDQTYQVSPRVFVYPGDRIKAEIRYENDRSNPGYRVWHIIMTDETHDLTTDLYDTGYAVDTNQNVMVFSGVLEGIGYVYNGIDLPPDVRFDGMTYKDESGKNMPIHLTGYTDPAFPQVAVEYEDGPEGSPVIIHTDYT